MDNNLIAKAFIRINAPTGRVWAALINPTAIKEYMFGAQVESDWNLGSSITWKGEWQGKTYEDKGTILQLEAGQLIQYSHFSPLSGLPDKPENYHTVTVELTPIGTDTRVLLTQDHNTSEEEREHSQKNWEMMLEKLKKFMEQESNPIPHDEPGIPPAMMKLRPLVGEWKIEAVRGESRQAGHASFDWLEGEAFLAEHWDFKPAELPPEATWIMGSDESTEIFSVLYHDSRGISRTLKMSMEDGTWKLWRDDPHFAQRLTGKISEDGNSIHVSLEKCLDGKNWEHDFDIIYTRNGYLPTH